jgi:hypothetical protein
MSFLAKLAGRGYHWYLPLKIGKALVAVPLFVLWLPVYAVAGTVVVLLTVTKMMLLEIPVEIFNEARDYWKRKWFRGFSRAFYRSLYK